MLKPQPNVRPKRLWWSGVVLMMFLTVTLYCPSPQSAGQESKRSGQ
jgi:hypothetical protein